MTKTLCGCSECVMMQLGCLRYRAIAIEEERFKMAVCQINIAQNYRASPIVAQQTWVREPTELPQVYYLEFESSAPIFFPFVRLKISINPNPPAIVQLLARSSWCSVQAPDRKISKFVRLRVD